MHSPAVLERFGCTSERIREIFTSKAFGTEDTVITTAGTRSSPEDETSPKPADKVGKYGKKDSDIRKKFEERIRSNVLNGITTNLANAKPLQAVDMAWDAPPIQKEQIPL